MANIELKQLKGIGPSIVEKLNSHGIFNLRDLCYTRRFGASFEKVTQVIDARPGEIMFDS